MANTLTGLIPTLYAALDRISRELVGFIPSVSSDFSVERVAKDQTIRSHIVPALGTHDINPGTNPADRGDMTIDYVDLTISKSKYAPVRWNGDEQLTLRSGGGQYDALAADRFTQAMRALVNEVEADVAGLYTKTSRAYGVAGTTPFGSDMKAVAEIRKILDDNGAPNDQERYLVIDTAAGVNLRSISNLFKANEAGTDETLRRGVLLDLYGLAIRESGQVKAHTAGVGTADETAGTDNEVGDTVIAMSAIGAGDYLAGDVIEIEGHKYVVVEMDASANTITIQEPGLLTEPGAGTTVTRSANYTASFAFHRSAMHLVTRAPAMPEEGDAADDVIEVQDPVSGLGFQVAMYRQYRQVKYEVGLAWGMQGVKPEHAALLLG